MHYKNGREAKNGDRVVMISSGQIVAGVLHSTNGDSTTCNGRIAAVTPNDAYVTISECLHADDVAKAAVPDSTK
jgi:hypothetical protein